MKEILGSAMSEGVRVMRLPKLPARHWKVAEVIKASVNLRRKQAKGYEVYDMGEGS